MQKKKKDSAWVKNKEGILRLDPFMFLILMKLVMMREKRGRVGSALGCIEGSGQAGNVPYPFLSISEVEKEHHR